MKVLFLIVAFAALASAQTSVGHILRLNQCIGWNAGNAMFSQNRCYRLEVQRDGNLVSSRTRDGWALWGSGTNGRGGYRACMQGDGNFVVLDAMNRSLWNTGTASRGRTVWIMDSGEVQVRNDPGYIIWRTSRTGTC